MHIIIIQAKKDIRELYSKGYIFSLMFTYIFNIFFITLLLIPLSESPNKTVFIYLSVLISKQNYTFEIPLYRISYHLQARKVDGQVSQQTGRSLDWHRCQLEYSGFLLFEHCQA